MAININLHNKFIITNDDNQYILTQPYIDENGNIKLDKKGAMISKNKRYYHTMEGIIEEVLREKLLKSDATTLEQYSIDMKDAIEYIKNILELPSIKSLVNK